MPTPHRGRPRTGSTAPMAFPPTPTKLATFRTNRASRLRRRHWPTPRSEEHTSELQSLMRISYAVFCLKKKNTTTINTTTSNKVNLYKTDQVTIPKRTSVYKHTTKEYNMVHKIY